MGPATVVCCLRFRDEHITRSYAVAKWAYCALFTLITVVTWVLRDYGDEWFLKHSAVFQYCQLPGYEALCSGKQVAMRFSFANVCVFGAHVLLLFWCTRETDLRAGVHSGLWLWKLLAWAGAAVGSFFVPAGAITVYAQVARVGAALFLVFVMVEMVSWVYDVNAWLVAAGSRPAWAALVAGALLANLGALALIGYSYWLYAPSPGCHLNLFFVTWSLVVGVALAAVLFLPTRLEEAGLLTSGAVFLYCSYLLYSALGRAPQGGCVREVPTDHAVQIVGFFLGIGAVCYSTMSLGTSTLFGKHGSGGGGGVADSGAGTEVAAVGGDSDERLPYRPDTFHLMFTLAAMYMAMLLTNWQMSPSTERFELNNGWTSLWFTMGSKWFCELLYLWTVVAPAVLPGRDWS